MKARGPVREHLKYHRQERMVGQARSGTGDGGTIEYQRYILEKLSRGLTDRLDMRDEEAKITPEILNGITGGWLYNLQIWR